jgi:hypothetical protein
MSPALSILQICNAVVIEKRINFAKMSNNNSILLLDPNFDPNAAIPCNLLLKITADSISYAIVNTENNSVEVLYDRQNFQDHQHTLLPLLQEDPHLKMSFSNVYVCSYTINSISIPNDFFKETELHTYRPYFTEPENYSQNLNTCTLGTRDFKTIFLFPNVVEEAINTHWPEAKKLEQTAPLLSTPQIEAGLLLAIDFTASSFFAMLIKDGGLIFQNFFLTENADEFSYYLMLIMKQLELDPAQVDVQISGIINEGDVQYKFLKNQFQSVHLHAPDAPTLENSIMEDMPAHYYTSLLALQLCE